MYAFARDLAQATDHLDHAILSAGILLGSYSQVSETGYETSLQVNAISPMLMSLLILPLLLASPRIHNESVTDRPHLTIVSSGGAWLVKKSSLSPYVDFEHPLRVLSKQENFPPGMMGGQWHYSRTKLMCEYSKRHLAMLSSLNDAKGQPKVLVASVCPGAVNSELSRHSANSGVLGAMARVVNGTVARTPEQGANIYISSLNLGVEGRGEMWTDDAISKDAHPFVAPDELKRLSDHVWEEIKEFATQVDEVHGSGVVKRLLA
jgi:NAD(P)-dependent dehydrogenase (short-subunit alcohol dehydrogenase family)